MSDVALRQAAIERLARLVAQGIPQKQIAQAMGLSEGRVSQLANTDEFRVTLAAMQSDQLEQMDALNKGWDAIEESAMGHVLQAMRTNPDPQFALSVATAANRAQRRGGMGNPAIQGGVTAVATISLNARFVARLQQEAPQREAGAVTVTEDGQRVDSLAVNEVDGMLASPEVTAQGDVVALFTTQLQMEPA